MCMCASPPPLAMTGSSSSQAIVSPYHQLIQTPSRRKLVVVVSSEEAAYADINQLMRAIAPELESDFAQFPLRRDEWVPVTGAAPDGAPAFVADEQPSSDDGATTETTAANASATTIKTKPDYINGPGPLGPGYYHLSTREAYEILHQRLLLQLPTVAVTSAARRRMKSLSRVRTIVHNRSLAVLPNDELAAHTAPAHGGKTKLGRVVDKVLYLVMRAH